MWSHHPESRGPGHGAVPGVHPAVPRQQALQGVPHDEDDGDPQARAHQHPAHYPLGVCGHVAPGESTEEEQERCDFIKAERHG